MRPSAACAFRDNGERLFAPPGRLSDIYFFNPYAPVGANRWNQRGSLTHQTWYCEASRMPGSANFEAAFKHAGDSALFEAATNRMMLHRVCTSPAISGYNIWAEGIDGHIR